MAQISYTNKVALETDPSIADINKITDNDMNEIKSVVNDNYNHTIQITDTEPVDNDCKLWIETGEVKSQASEITNEYSESTGIGYSADYINNLHTYSTAEQRIGTWIDGKPIYRKGFQFSFQGSSGENSFNTDISSISNFNNFVSLNFEALIGTNLYISQNYYSGNNNFLFIFYRNKKIEYRLGVGGSTALNGYAFIEYTKTTD